ncbi:hypothetical protein [Atlanticothrix silvestris]|nr:hypothetical protein [Atlanticothrix silvestris]
MSGEVALDTSVAIRFLNGDVAITERVLTLTESDRFINQLLRFEN